jgi:hypothetical protein
MMIRVDRDGTTTVTDEEAPDREPFQISAAVPPEIRDQLIAEFGGKAPGFWDRIVALWPGARPR